LPHNQQKSSARTVTFCNTLQRRAQLNTLQHTATYCNTPTHGCHRTHRNRVRGKILASVKNLSLAVVFARWRAHGDTRAHRDVVGPGGVVGRHGNGGGHAFASYRDSSSSCVCHAITLGGGGGGGETLWPCTHARQDACQRCFSENPRQTACSHGRHDASFDDLEAGLSESGLC